MLEYQVRSSVANLEEYEVETIDAKIVVNANESNYPLPVEVQEAITEATKDFAFNRYPPMKAENLCAAIARELQVDPASVKIGNGSSELLQQVCYAFGGPGRKIMVPYPSFSMYIEYAELADSIPVKYPLTEEGYVDPDLVIEMCRKELPALLIVCNPNNPTGNYNSLAAMEKIIANVKCPVVMDEAYMEFADGKEVPPNDLRPLNKMWLVAGSTLGLLPKYNNLMVFKTFSKAYGMAGLRCGYAVGSLAVIRQLGKALLPYHVNAFTLMAAKAVYEHKELYKERLKEIKAQRELLRSNFERLGFRVYPSATNFIMVRPEGETAQKLAALYYRDNDRNLEVQAAAGTVVFRYYLKNSILLRDFTKHPVLQGALRITVGMPEENKEILSKLNELCLEAGI